MHFYLLSFYGRNARPSCFSSLIAHPSDVDMEATDHPLNLEEEEEEEEGCTSLLFESVEGVPIPLNSTW